MENVVRLHGAFSNFTKSLGISYFGIDLRIDVDVASHLIVFKFEWVVESACMLFGDGVLLADTVSCLICLSNLSAASTAFGSLWPFGSVVVDVIRV